MKICVVLPCNIYIAPFYKHYINFFKESNVSFDLIYWNRSNIIEETHSQKSFVFNEKDELNSGKILKFFKYIRFAKFVKKHLKKNKYDRIVILSSYAGIMVFLSSFLKNQYSQKYWLDIRDFTFENLFFYYKGMKKAISNSKVTAISSPGYKEFLPEWDYLEVHNTNLKEFDKAERIRESNKPIRISFIGLVRYYEENKKLLTIFKNDDRFKLQYYGKNSEVLEEFCKKEKILNVEFYGQFSPEETINFYKKTDIINNVYGNQNIAERTALSNKLYFSANNSMPILVSNNTIMKDLTTKLGLGYTIIFENQNLPQELFDWYSAINYDDINAKTNSFLNEIRKDNLKFEKEFKDFILRS